MLRTWHAYCLQVLPWPDVGFTSTLKSVLESIAKLENPSGLVKRKGQQARKRGRKAEVDAAELEDSDFDAEDDGVAAKRSKRSAHAKADGETDLADDEHGAAGANEPAETAAATAGGKKRASNVASRFARRKTGAASKRASAQAATAEPPAAMDDDAMEDVVTQASKVCA